MATAQATLIERTGWFKSNWLIGGRDDLIWFISSVVSSYILLGLVLKAGSSGAGLFLVFLVWALIFDGPHVFGTFSRTYFDAQERRTRARLLYGSLLFFAIGPALVLTGKAALINGFFFFAGMWAYYHLVKQHYGFMVLYKKKNNDLDPVDNFIDRAFLLLALNYPFVYFVLKVGQPVSSDDGKVYTTYQVVDFAIKVATPENARRVYVPLFFPQHIANWIDSALFWLFVVTAVLFLARQVQKFVRQEPLNLPKHLLLLAAVPMHWAALKLLAPTPYGAFTIVPVLTIYHNIQYHRLIWFHNKNKYHGEDKRQYGAASLISKSFLFYAVFGLIFNFFYHIPRSFLAAPYGMAAGFFWGYAFIHYYLDSKIWRVRRDVKLNQSLRMESA